MSTEPENAELRSVSEEEGEACSDAWSRWWRTRPDLAGRSSYPCFAAGWAARAALPGPDADAYELAHSEHYLVQIGDLGQFAPDASRTWFGRCACGEKFDGHLPVAVAQRWGEHIAAVVAAPGGRAEEAELARVVRQMIEDGHPDDPDWFRIVGGALRDFEAPKGNAK